MFLSRIDTPARHIIISVKNEDSNNIFWFWQIFFSRQKYFWLRSEKYDRSTSYQIKRMQFRNGVQHLPAPAAGEAAGRVGQSPGGGEREKDGWMLCDHWDTGHRTHRRHQPVVRWGQNSTGRLNVAKRLESYNEISGNFHIEWRRSLI